MKTKSNLADTKTKYAFSYSRFSSIGQDETHGGSSIERQEDRAVKLAVEKGWKLRTEWNVKQEAVSAFKLANFPKLHAIIALAKNRTIPQGTVCIVEAIDRLTRASLDEGREMLRQMLLAGIEICDNEGNHYTKKSLNDLGQLIIMLLKLVAANEYSSRLSSRVSASVIKRQERLANGEKVKTGHIAGWIDEISEKDSNKAEYKLNAKAETVRAIFQDYVNGKSIQTIAKDLNGKNIETIGGRGKWGYSTVYYLLSECATMGALEFKDTRIDDYFPAAISKELYLKAQAKLEANKKAHVNVHKTGILNLFSGVAYCICGEKIRVLPNGGYPSISCYSRLNNFRNADGSAKCTSPQVKYFSFEDAFCHVLRLNPAQLKEEAQDDGQSSKLAILRGKLATANNQIANLTQSQADAYSKSVALKLAALESEVETIQADILSEMARKTVSNDNGKAIEEIQANLSEIKRDQKLRAKIQYWIRSNVEKIELDKAKEEFTTTLKNGKAFTMDFSGNMKGIASLNAVFGLSGGKVA